MGNKYGRCDNRNIHRFVKLWATQCCSMLDSAHDPLFPLWVLVALGQVDLLPRDPFSFHPSTHGWVLWLDVICHSWQNWFKTRRTTPGTNLLHSLAWRLGKQSAHIHWYMTPRSKHRLITWSPTSAGQGTRRSKLQYSACRRELFRCLQPRDGHPAAALSHARAWHYTLGRVTRGYYWHSQLATLCHVSPRGPGPAVFHWDGSGGEIAAQSSGNLAPAYLFFSRRRSHILASRACNSLVR